MVDQPHLSAAEDRRLGPVQGGNVGSLYENSPLGRLCLLYTSLDENITAVGIPARPVKKDGVPIPKKPKTVIGEHDQKILEELESLRNQVERLKNELEEMKNGKDGHGEDRHEEDRHEDNEHE